MLPPPYHLPTDAAQTQAMRAWLLADHPRATQYIQDNASPELLEWVASHGFDLLPVLAQAIKIQVDQDPYWWDRWGTAQFPALMLKHSQDPSWVKRLAFVWDESIPIPRNEHNTASFPAHIPYRGFYHLDPEQVMPAATNLCQSAVMSALHDHQPQMLDALLSEPLVRAAALAPEIKSKGQSLFSTWRNLGLDDLSPACMDVLSRHNCLPGLSYANIFQNLLSSGQVNTAQVLANHASQIGLSIPQEVLGLGWIKTAVKNPSVIAQAIEDLRTTPMWNEALEGCQHPLTARLVSRSALRTLHALSEHAQPHITPVIASVCAQVIPLLGAHHNIAEHVIEAVSTKEKLPQAILAQNHAKWIDVLNWVGPYLPPDQQQQLQQFALCNPHSPMAQSPIIQHGLLHDQLPTHTPSAPKRKL